MANQSREGTQQQSKTQQAQAPRDQGALTRERGRGQSELGYGRGSSQRTPFGLVGRMMADMDRWFGGGFGDFGRFEGSLGSEWNPQIEVLQRNGNLVVRADLPGLKPEDVEVRVEDDILTVRGERKYEHEDEREGIYHCERSYGRFERSVALPRGVDPNAIDAKFDNGVLEISAPLPKEQARGRTIDVKGGTTVTPKQPDKSSH
jgi:HSP20 family protein